MDANIPVTSLPRVVIVGAGFGGLQVAKRLRKAPVQVILLDKNNYHNFQPLLYQVATGGLNPDSIAYPIRKVFVGQHNLIFRLAEVTRLDTEQGCVQTTIGTIPYDYLVLATGSMTNFFGIRSIEEYAMQIKTIPEALNLRSLIFQNFERAILADSQDEREALMSIVVVGGGPTGTELCGALAEMRKHVVPNDYPELDFRSMRIALIEATPKILNGFSDEASEKAKAYLHDMGIDLYLDMAVEKYEGGFVYFGKGKRIRSETVIWAAGVVGAAVPGLAEAVVAPNMRIKVNAFSQVEGLENVFAIGDAALLANDLYPRGYPMVAQPAIQQGELVAKNLQRVLRKEPMQPFSYNDKGAMATVGRNRAVVDLKHFKFQWIFAWFVWMFVHLLFLVGFRNKVVTFIDWLWNYFSYDRALRLIIRPFHREGEIRESTTPSATVPEFSGPRQTS